MDGLDLRKFQYGGEDHDKVKSIMGKILSGRDGYEPIIEVRKDIKKCECGKILEGNEKFCPECGKKVN
ncbi:MAG: hypothetical protein ACOYT4_00885 [Nanoarchaeota archaeon]